MTLGTLTAGVSRIHRNHGNADAARLVFDKTAELPESPIVQRSPLTAADIYPVTNALEVFNGNSVTGVECLGYDAFGNNVIDVSLVALLFAGEPTEFPLGHPAAIPLQVAATVAMDSSLLLHGRTGVTLSGTVCGKVDDSKVNTKNIGTFNRLGLLNLARDEENKLAMSVDSKFRFLPLAEKKFALGISARERNFTIAVHDFDLDNSFASRLDIATNQRKRGIASERNVAVPLSTRCNLADNRLDKIGWESESFLDFMVDGSIQFKPESDVVLIGSLSNGLASSNGLRK